MTDEPPAQDPDPGRLEEIGTEWGLLEQAHANSGAAGAARNALVLRYARAIRNYVGGLVKDPQDADEVAQEVLVRLLRGQFAAASPERGRFRRMLAAAAHNLVRTYWVRKRRRAGADVDVDALAAEEGPAPDDAEAVAGWRQAMLDLAWKALEEYERGHPGTVPWTVLKLRAEHPEDDSERLAAHLSERTGRPFRPEAVRQQLRRARVRFAQALWEEVARGLDDPAPERVEEELTEVGLLEYVQDFIPPEFRSRGGPSPGA
jgi:DNA-directed RNA polymerase specialized sigma24 family protein